MSKKGYVMSSLDGLDEPNEEEQEVEINPEDGTPDEGDAGEPSDVA